MFFSFLRSLDKSLLLKLWTDIFGLSKVGTFKSASENVDEDIVVLGGENSPYAVEVDLMTPIDPEKSPKVHLPPLNHFGLWVDDLEAAVVSMEKSGKLNQGKKMYNPFIVIDRRHHSYRKFHTILNRLIPYLRCSIHSRRYP